MNSDKLFKIFAPLFVFINNLFPSLGAAVVEHSEAKTLIMYLSHGLRQCISAMLLPHAVPS